MSAVRRWTCPIRTPSSMGSGEVSIGLISPCWPLICPPSLGGAAYASLRIPNGSVGEKQLKNRVIDPIKWDPSYTTGFVRRWATVNGSGALMSTSPAGQSKATGTGSYVVTWGDAFAGWCAPVATVIGGSATRPPTGISGPTGPSGPTRPSGPSGPSGPTGPTSPGSGAYADAKIFPRSGQSPLAG